MKLREKLIHFQNSAEQQFLEKKSAATLFRYILALIVFFSSTFFAAVSLPFRLLARLFQQKNARTSVHKLDSGNLDSILKKEPLVLIDFWAEWCGPCIMMQPALEKFADSNKSVYVAKVNADANKKLLDRFKIRGLPHLILLKDGKEVKRHAGPMTQADLEKLFSLTTSAVPLSS